MKWWGRRVNKDRKEKGKIKGKGVERQKGGGVEGWKVVFLSFCMRVLVRCTSVLVRCVSVLVRYASVAVRYASVAVKCASVAVKCASVALR